MRRALLTLLLTSWLLAGLPACGQRQWIEVYNPAGVREDGVYVDELLKKTIQEQGKTRPPLAGQFPKGRVERVRIVRDATAEVNELFYRRGWTDGLPIVPPTKEKVQAMLRAIDLPPEQVVGTVDLMRGQATVEKIAVNAVMAGCRPEYMPLLIAAVQAICEPDFGLIGLASTTNPDTPMLIVNGPIAKELDINSGTNALGRGWQANATIGRALHLIINNVGGSWPGVNDMSCLGTPGDFTMMLAENEDKNPWEPLHVELGFAREADVVTVVGAEGTHGILGSGWSSEGFLRLVSDHLAGLERTERSVVVLIIAQDRAAMLARDGWTKPKIREFIAEHARIPFSKYKERFIDAGKAVPASVRGITDPDALVPVPVIGQLIILVAGGPGEKSMLIPGWGGSKAVSKQIRLPADWDVLLGEARK